MVPAANAVVTALVHVVAGVLGGNPALRERVRRLPWHGEPEPGGAPGRGPGRAADHTLFIAGWTFGWGAGIVCTGFPSCPGLVSQSGKSGNSLRWHLSPKKGAR
ncbi:hypothetical protein GCM10010317_016270 [Streptomyces mirabilis]|nr:hypothetical protein GCM10010317_016270 [Streptomyces mirabilis]